MKQEHLKQEKQQQLAPQIQLEEKEISLLKQFLIRTE